MKKFEFKNMNAKQKKMLHGTVRALIQLLFLILVPSAFTVAFSGVKYIFTRLGAGELIASNPFVKVLIALCIYTFVFGRFFCGFACAFGTLGDAVHAIYTGVCKKLKKKPIQMKEGMAKKLVLLKYVVLIAIILLCYAGIYSKTQGYSPWDVFSLLIAGNFKLKKYTVGIVLFVLILIGMFFQERFFCRFLCPMGAVFSLLPVLPAFSPHRNRENCIPGCRACARNCPSNLELSEEGSMAVMGDCFQCQKCMDTCPRSNIHCGVGIVKGNELWFTLLRALLLFLLFLWLGI